MLRTPLTHAYAHDGKLSIDDRTILNAILIEQRKQLKSYLDVETMQSTVYKQELENSVIPIMSKPNTTNEKQSSSSSPVHMPYDDTC
jgi:hypothetical protein